MQRVELKRIVEFLWRGSGPAEEKTPLARKDHTNNGAIAKDLNMNNSEEGIGKEVEKPADEPVPMSVLRKLAFFLSLNLGVLYVVGLAWLLPCNQPPCIPSLDRWQLNLTNVLVTTNLEVTNTPGLPSLALYGYADEIGGKLGALNMLDGRIAWNTSLKFIPRHVFCHFRIPFDANMDDIPDCVLTGYNVIGAFNVSSGDILWQRNFASVTGTTVNSMSVMKHGNKTHLICVSGMELYLLDARNGDVVLKTTHKCSGPIDVKLTPSLSSGNHTIWGVLCNYGDNFEVWTFNQQEMLNSADDAREEDFANDLEFSLLFSKESFNGSMDLAGDVTVTPDSLVLSWADMVVMVTAEAPFHLREKWDRRFLGPLKHPSIVTSVVAGRFLESKDVQIAVTVQKDSNVTLHILDAKNSSSLAISHLGKGVIRSMNKIPGAKHETDYLVMELASTGPSSNNITNSSKSQLHRKYFVLRYQGETAKVRNIVTSEAVYVSTVSKLSDGMANLLLVRRTEDDSTIVNGYLVRNDFPPNFCADNDYNDN